MSSGQEGMIVKRLADLSGEVKRSKRDLETMTRTGISGWDEEEEISERVLRTNECGRRVEIGRNEDRKEIGSVGRLRVPLNRTYTARRSLPMRTNSFVSIYSTALLPIPKHFPSKPIKPLRSSIVFIPLYRPKRKKQLSVDLSSSLQSKLMVSDKVKPSTKVCTLTMPSALPRRQVRPKPTSLDLRIGKLASIYRC